VRHQQVHRDRGATVVEAAFALPILLVLFLGMAEVGIALKTYSSAADAARAGGRAASVAGSDPMADASTLERLAAASATVGHGEIDLVVIWHAADAGTSVPAACVPATGTGPNIVSVGVSDGGADAVGACNVYLRPAAPGGAFAMAGGELAHPASYYFGCQGAADPQASHKVDCKWPGKDRRALVTPRSGVGSPRPPDFVGVFLRVDHRILTARLGSSLTIEETSINLIEPEGYDLT
jgi:hypothetical protein